MDLREVTSKAMVLAAIVILAISLVPGCDKKETPVAPTEIAFVANYQAALDAAQIDGKKIIVDFYTDW